MSIERGYPPRWWADHLDVAVRTVYRWMKERRPGKARLEYNLVGARPRITQSQMSRFFDEKKAECEQR